MLSRGGGWVVNSTAPSTHPSQKGRSGPFLPGAPLKLPEGSPHSLSARTGEYASGTREEPSWVTPGSKDKPHVPQVRGHPMPEQTHGCVSKDRCDYLRVTSVNGSPRHPRRGWLCSFKHLSSSGDHTGMDRTRARHGLTRRLCRSFSYRGGRARVTQPLSWGSAV